MAFDQSKRINPRSLETGNQHWARTIADEVLKAFPDKDVYTAAAGISPSGVVHFGNFRDVMTSFAVLQALKEKGKQTRFVFSWDNFDRFRKVPAGVPESFSQYIGMPISKIPDPTGKYASYAESFQKPFEESMRKLGIELEYKNQTELYESGAYAEKVILAMQKRKEIGEVMFSLMSEKAIKEKCLTKESFVESYFPIAIYSRFTGKDFTEIRSFNGESKVTYYCKETKQEETIDLKTDFCYKLPWKVDWPMRWMHEEVVFEPGGHDHASPGSSFDVSSIIAKEIFSSEPPVFVEYKFVGIVGMDGKMSGSKGGAVSPEDLLQIYEARLLKWLYLRKTPAQPFNLAFDSEIYRQYEEYDLGVKKLENGELDAIAADSLAWSLSESEKHYGQPTSFRQTVAFGQIMQWDASKMLMLFESAGAAVDSQALKNRIPKAKNWLDIYNTEEKISIRTEPNTAYYEKMTEEGKGYVATLLTAIEKNELIEENLEQFIYDIAKDESLDQKENAVRQRAFFKDLYNLLISKDTGPRLSTFIVALGFKKVRELLKI